MNDILPPKRPQSKPGGDIMRTPRPVQIVTPHLPPQPQLPPAKPNALSSFGSTQQTSPPASKPIKRKKKLVWLIVSMLVCVVVVTAAAYIWYTQALLPVNTNDQTKVRVEIASGSSPEVIGKTLEDKKLIKSQAAFDIYTRVSGTRSKLRAGTYSLSPSETTAAIVSHLTSGKVDQYNLTFLPGATLQENKKVLLGAGFKSEDIDAAFIKTYDHPLFTNKPQGTDLEGYIYGETYAFDSSATLESILTTTFDHYYEIIKEDNLIDGFKHQGLNLYQGITLASIVQREVPTATDQKQVAQVFYQRLRTGMQLGSDVTYQYAAKKLGVAPTPELDSPYNTRKYPGLPPGPIATPGRSALDAVANPASGDFLYFLSGDDDKTYFSHTSEEHEANIRDHCQVKCSVL